MVASTPKGIRYPQLADRPVDLPVHLADMANDIDALLAAHDTDLERTIRPPAMMLRLSTATPLANSISTPASGVGAPVPFDSIEQQQGGTFARLNVNSALFRMPRTGYYQVGLHYFMAKSFDSDSPATDYEAQWNFNLVKFPLTLEPIRQQHFDSPSTIAEGDPGEQGSVTGLIRATSVTDYYFWSFYATGTGGSFDPTQLILGARAFAFWTADL
jgi:hypothetical protein